MPTTILSREKGFTLLEVVFAVGILAIGILGYTSLKISNRYSWFFAKNLTQAVQLTAGNLEGLLMAGYNDARLMSDGTHSSASADTYYLTPPLSAGKGSDFTASALTWTVREGCPSELTKLVKYTTEWSNGNNELELTQVQVRP